MNTLFQPQYEGLPDARAKFKQVAKSGLDPSMIKFYYNYCMTIKWNILLSRIIAVVLFFLSLVFFIDRGNFWLAIIIPPPLSVVGLFLVRRFISKIAKM